ncbi:penicillin-binding protein 2 [uncultured Cellulomonas sp.]|uniref:peptidoglycan D,D-transpeptidase FtsI family protein n=1 Tax=uncultured Cellulomonas sp. TaxID=189682 RepID=UPI00260F60F2|nr:penicillin-binding protein 2 [uncultured Cellulomonas sp.]
MTGRDPGRGRVATPRPAARPTPAPRPTGTTTTPARATRTASPGARTAPAGARTASTAGRGATRGAARTATTERPTARTLARAATSVETRGAAVTGGAVPAAADPDRRHRVLLGIALALLVVFAGRLFYVQGLAGSAVAATALEERMSTATLVAPRGQITDAEGVALATTVERYVLWVNQAQIATFKRTVNGTVVAEGPAGAAQILAPLLDVDAGELGFQLTGDRTYVEIRRGVLPEVWRAIRQEGITGVEADRADERIYPAGSVAGNVVGFLNQDGEALAGLERALDDELTGVDGTYRYERGAGGQEIPGGAREQTPAQPGHDVRTTIWRDLQWKAQEAVDQQLVETGSDSAALVAMKVDTGEILALVDSGAVDPNEPGRTPADRRGSRAISDVFEPGSTAKVITMAAAIESGITDPYQPWEVPYTYTTANGQTFKDSHEHGLEKLTTTGILAESSNTGTVMLGQQIPEQVRYDYLAKFGFGTPTGLELQNESAGILHPVDAWDGRTKYAVLFGQGVSVNAVQATQVFATIANGGVRMPAHLVRDVTAPDGTVTAAPPGEGTRVVSEATADTVLTMLESAVDEGTGSKAAIPGYRVAGKTGTAQSWGSDGRTGITASFIGVAPADDPQIAVAVIMHNPRTSEWGGDVAAPVFSEVAGFALQMLSVPPTGAPATLFPTTYE